MQSVLVWLKIHQIQQLFQVFIEFVVSSLSEVLLEMLLAVFCAPPPTARPPLCFSISRQSEHINNSNGFS